MSREVGRLTVMRFSGIDVPVVQVSQDPQVGEGIKDQA